MLLNISDLPLIFQSTVISLISHDVGPKVFFCFVFLIRKLVSGPAESWNANVLAPQKNSNKKTLTGSLYNEVEKWQFAEDLEFQYS